MFDTRDAGHTVEFEMRVQIMNGGEGCALSFDSLDFTNVWSKDLFPLMSVGRTVLNEKPKDFFVEVEPSAFSPTAIVPGIDFSNENTARAYLCLWRYAKIPYGCQLFRTSHKYA